MKNPIFSLVSLQPGNQFIVQKKVIEHVYVLISLIKPFLISPVAAILMCQYISSAYNGKHRN